MGHASRFWASIFCAVVLFAAAGFEASGLGAQETAVRDVRGFHSVALNTSGALILTQGDREALEVVAGAEDLPNIVTEVRDGTLFIGREGPGTFFSLRQPVFRLTMKDIAGLETHSSGSITAHSIRVDSLRVRISSSGSISIDSLVADNLDVQVSSSGSFGAAGKVHQQEVLLSSSGSYSGGKLASTKARVMASSSGSATLRVSDSLEATVTSSGDVRYYGKPQRVDGKVTSSGRLVKLGD